jgi:acyl-CoA synthetase (AMP-forming)/AMP-acid ligase II
MGNRAEVVEILLAAIQAGIWLTPVNRHLVPEELDYVIADSGAKVLFADETHAEAARRSPAPCVMEAGAPLETALSAVSDAPLPPGGPPGANLIYTSGTTGRPKGVMRARKGSVAEQLAYLGEQGRAVGLDGSGPHLVTGPLYHAAPLMFAVYDLVNGAPMLVMPRFDEREALRWITERGVAHAHFVPTMFVRLLRLPDAERAAFDPSPLRLVLHGAAPIARGVKERMLEWWGPVLTEYWGGTESGVVTWIGAREWLAHPGSVGRPLPHYEVFAADPERRPLPPGETGELFCRHRSLEQVFRYHGDPAKTAAAHPEPRLLALGDLGAVDAEGYVFLTDRKAHTIISGGVNVYPSEVENALGEHPAVADVAVFGVPDDEWGESVKAAVELRPGHVPSPALERELLAFARRHLAGYKVPRSIDFEARLPREPSGKLTVRRLRDRYWQGRERRI